MSDNVQWVGKDGGWKTGVKVNIQGYIRRQLMPEWRGCSTLVQHSCTNELEFVAESKLQPWPTRTERGEEPYGTHPTFGKETKDIDQDLGQPTPAYVNQD